MPRKSMRKCSELHCPNLTNDTYCAKHSKDREDRDRQSDREYKRLRQDKKEQSFYSSSEWIRLRDYKKQCNPLCQHCLAQGKLTPVEVIDHVIEIKDNFSLRLSFDNLESLCNRCHAIKTAKVRREREKGK